MTLQIGRTPYDQMVAAVGTAPAHKVVTDAHDPKAHQKTTGVEESGTIVGDVPPAPTPEARELVADAAEVVQKLHENNRELHFSKDHESGRMIIEVRDLDGKVLKTIPPKDALDFLTGDADL